MAAAFCKPSMPLFYGFLLVLLLIHEAWLARSQGFSLRAFLPATLVAIVMACTLGLAYGPAPLLYSIVPIRGAGVYRANNYGFFGLGRDFWGPEGARWTYYLGSPIGFWILASVVLVLGALEALASTLGRPGSDRDRHARRSEISVCSAVLHLSFVLLFFGNAWSWAKYCYLPFMGVSAMARRSRSHASVVLIVAALAVVGGLRPWAQEHARAWKQNRRSPQFLGVWVDPDDRREWSEIIPKLHGRRAAVLATANGLGVWHPGFLPPVGFYLSSAEVTAKELELMQQQMISAEFVLEVFAANSDHRRWPSDRWPELKAALAGCQQIHSSDHYRLYRRDISNRLASR